MLPILPAAANQPVLILHVPLLTHVMHARSLSCGLCSFLLTSLPIPSAGQFSAMNAVRRREGQDKEAERCFDKSRPPESESVPTGAIPMTDPPLMARRALRPARRLRFLQRQRKLMRLLLMHELMPLAFGRVLFHLNLGRSFQSNRKREGGFRTCCERWKRSGSKIFTSLSRAVAEGSFSVSRSGMSATQS